MKAATSVIAAGCVAVLALGCASTRLTSQADPAAHPAPYDTLVVFAPFEDLAMRQVAEESVVKDLGDLHAGCLASAQLFFPGRSFSTDEMHATLRDHHVRGILVLSGVAAGTTESYVPPTYYTQSTAWISGSQGGATSTTQGTGGFLLRRPWAQFRGELIDTESEQRVWIATAHSSGNAYASSHTLLRSFCGQIVNRLVADHLVTPRVHAWHDTGGI